MEVGVGLRLKLVSLPSRRLMKNLPAIVFKIVVFLRFLSVMFEMENSRFSGTFIICIYCTADCIDNIISMYT